MHNVYFSWAPVDGALKGFRIDLGVDNLADAAQKVVAAVKGA